jgi:hypothetical protein
MAFVSYLIKELQDRSGGNPFDNRNVIYNGTLDDNAVNSAIPRYARRSKSHRVSAQLLFTHGRIQKPCSQSTPVTIRWCRSVSLTPTNRPRRTPAPARFRAAIREARRALRHHAGEIASGFSQLRTWKSTGVRPRAARFRRRLPNL